MKRSIFYTILLITVIGLASCKKQDCGCHEAEKHPVLFQYEYFNYAWGYKHLGFLIEGNGKVRGFNNPKNWKMPDSTGMMSRSDLEYNLAQCDTLYLTVKEEDMDKYYADIESLRDGEIIDTGIYMADAGTGTFSAWYWNEKAEKYQFVFLKSYGDQNKVNSHASVDLVADWLCDIGKNIWDYFWLDAI
ncbi:MAG: hypothetical protein PHY99_00035 [Bacteroidales bacterium]|nr:hypothetical protein [Bacteroidales bacterium]